MIHRFRRGVILVWFVIALGMTPLLVSAAPTAAPDKLAKSGTTSPAAPIGNAGGEATTYAPPQGQPIVGKAVKSDVSKPLREIPPLPIVRNPTIREMPEPRATGNTTSDATQPIPFVDDPVVQRDFGAASKPASPQAMPTPSVNFEGVGNLDAVYPPDPNGDVGPNHYVQMVNLHFQIFNKAGASLYGPAANSTLWSGFGAPCETNNNGDPIVLYDALADRWLLSQFIVIGPYGECVAVSSTGDPTGTYYRYYFQFSTTVLYDYPKFGVWPDGYYLSANRFTTVYQGPSAIVLNRSQMLNGIPAATYQEFTTISTAYGTLLPADHDGLWLPPAGSPNFFAEIGTAALHLWKLHVDWNTPGNSSLTGPASLTVAPYTILCPGTRNCIPQPGTTQKVAGLGDRLMHRLAYRNMGSYETLVVNHSVDAGSVAGVRWYEVRNPNISPILYQQGTYTPNAVNRWLGSIAMDRMGNIALGFSVSSGIVFPGIRYAGRLVDDTLGTMGQGEEILINGSGSQTGTAARWGDYASMTIDPADNCTFWFTSEYIPTTSLVGWHTRIGAFKFPSCTNYSRLFLPLILR